MDRARTGFWLAVAGSLLLLAAVGLDVLAGDLHLVREQGTGTLTGGGTQPWLVVFIPLQPGDKAELLDTVTAGPNYPTKWWIVEANQAQAALNGEPVSWYDSGGGEPGGMHARFERTEHPDAGSMGVAFVWKTTRPLSNMELQAFEASIRGEHCCVLGNTGDFHEPTAASAFITLGIGIAVLVTGVVLWLRHPPVADESDAGLLAVFRRSRAYVGQLAVFATLALVLLAVVSAIGFVQLLQEFNGFGNPFEGFLFGNTALWAFLFAMGFPFLWMLRLRQQTKRESARLALLDAESPL